MSAVHPVYGGEDLGLKVPTTGNIFGVGFIIAKTGSLRPLCVGSISCTGQCCMAKSNVYDAPQGFLVIIGGVEYSGR